MPADVKFLFDDDIFTGDVILGNGDLERDEGLRSAVIISLYSDRRADDTDEFDNNDRRGWWGDLLSEVEGDQIGSKLWLLQRSKNTQQVVNNAKQYAFEALEWMIEDGVAQDIEVDAWVFGDVSNLRLGLYIKIYRSQDNFFELKFNDFWQAEIEESEGD